VRFVEDAGGRAVSVVTQIDGAGFGDMFLDRVERLARK
jgi:hypothetical protein